MSTIQTVFLSNWQLGVAAIAIAFPLWRLTKKIISKSSGTNIANVPGPASPSWLVGNFLQVYNPAAWGFHEYLAQTYKMLSDFRPLVGTISRLHAPFGGSALYIYDPQVLQNILIKVNYLMPTSSKKDLNSLSHHHRRQRKMLNPAFSATNIRAMTPTFFEVAHKLESTLKQRLQTGDSVQEVDILSWMGRTALELIGQAGLGYSFDPLTNESSAHPYSKIIKELLTTMERVAFWSIYVLPYVSRIGSPGFRRFVVNILPWKDLHQLRDMSDYMQSIAVKVYESKKLAFEAGDEAVAEQIGRGKDIISILMRENMKEVEGSDRLQENEVLGQVSASFHLYSCPTHVNLSSKMNTLIFAAMDTTSSAMTRIIELLSKHPETQEKLRREIVEAKDQKDVQDLSYEELTNLPFLDAICRETLRLYAPVPTLARVALQDAIVPLSNPITGLDGTELHQVAIPKGTNIFISALNANRNPDLWGKDALEWKPERWLSPLPDALLEAHIPGVYSICYYYRCLLPGSLIRMTFLGGRRSCIGFTFSQLEMKVVISVLVESFNFSPSKNDSEIVWRMSGVSAPTTGGDTQLPVILSLAS
ncbi:cytochrome P450 [Rhodocollybia butyracea]|uniref:Cytochrome P450 n=1 Tax=Rhodocollybia butyracea TaxID=206335 RepID=A0A9P5PGJ7_9AGAR|nr:cytochrome P450 [Rhodocollybia butyracea]